MQPICAALSAPAVPRPVPDEASLATQARAVAEATARPAADAWRRQDIVVFVGSMEDLRQNPKHRPDNPYFLLGIGAARRLRGGRLTRAQATPSRTTSARCIGTAAAAAPTHAGTPRARPCLSL
jgi:hypothetical protein